MASIIVDYTFTMCFELFILYRQGPTNVAEPGVTSPYSTSRRAWVR